MSYPYVMPVTPQQRVDGLSAALRMGQFSPDVAAIVWQEIKNTGLTPCELHPESWKNRKRQPK